MAEQDPNVNTTGLVTRSAPTSLTDLYYLKNILANLGGAAATALQTLVGALTETAPATDTASSGLNGRLQRIAQRLTTTITNAGDVADAAWTSGSGSIIALLKAIAGAAISTNPNQVYTSNSFVNITTATTTVVKSGAGTFGRLQVNLPGTTNNVTIYDNTAASGTVIATHTAITLREINYDLAFATGLTIVTSAACDLTVTYR